MYTWCSYWKWVYVYMYSTPPFKRTPDGGTNIFRTLSGGTIWKWAELWWKVRKFRKSRHLLHQKVHPKFRTVRRP